MTEPAASSPKNIGSVTTFRPNVAAILKDPDGKILVCERVDLPGAWQFPQGGVQPRETPEIALARELEEELSLRHGDYLLAESHGPYRYAFENGRTKEGYGGQEQRYFLVELIAAKEAINLETAHREFRAMRWIALSEFQLDWLPAMKRPVYAAVFNDFFGIVFPGYEGLAQSEHLS